MSDDFTIPDDPDVLKHRRVVPDRRTESRRAPEIISKLCANCKDYETCYEKNILGLCNKVNKVNKHLSECYNALDDLYNHINTIEKSRDKQTVIANVLVLIASALLGLIFLLLFN